jgi:precorrin isomerase
MITALTSSVDFIYTFEYNNETIEYQLKDGESIIFDPDLVKHGMKNKSKTKTRYALVQVFKAYPVTEWMKNFINKKETVIL